MILFWTTQSLVKLSMNHIKRYKDVAIRFAVDVFCGLVDCDIVTLRQTHSAV